MEDVEKTLGKIKIFAKKGEKNPDDF